MPCVIGQDTIFVFNQPVTYTTHMPNCLVWLSYYSSHFFNDNLPVYPFNETLVFSSFSLIFIVLLPSSLFVIYNLTGTCVFFVSSVG